MRNKFFASLLVLLIAILCQWNAKNFFGWSPDFVLAALMAFSFFFGFLEIAFMGVMSALILNWQPRLGAETAALIIVPLAALAAKKFLPWRNEANLLLLTIAGILIFYGFTSPASFAGNTFLFLKIIISTLVFSLFLFWIFRHFYKTR